jgi:hypothetical protein
VNRSDETNSYHSKKRIHWIDGENNPDFDRELLGNGSGKTVVAGFGTWGRV